METPIKFDTIKSRWSMVYIKGSQVINSKNMIFLSLKIDFVLANSVCQSTRLRVSGTQSVKLS